MGETQGMGDTQAPSPRAARDPLPEGEGKVFRGRVSESPMSQSWYYSSGSVVKRSG